MGVTVASAVTSPLQVATLHETASSTLAATAWYELHKLDDRDTAAKCRAWGVRLIPMVAESFWGVGCGGSEDIQNLLRRQGRTHRRQQQQSGYIAVLRGSSIKLARASARSLLARVALATPDDVGSGATSRALHALAATAA